jgi:patatin-like phospholipase/acyl hydrolase
LYGVFGEQTLGESKSRLVIPSCMIPKSEVAVFKTDHHSDYKRDHKMLAWEVCRATSAAPTFFAGHERNGRMFVDGGLWANNPIMVAVTEALSCFDLEPSQIQVLSIGTGNKPYDISLKKARGGWFQWKFALTGAMHLSTENASAQVGLFIGNRNVTRIEPEHQIADIEMDDWVEAKKHLPDAAKISFSEGKSALEPFFRSKVQARYRIKTDN